MNEAHVAALLKAEIISKDEARKLTRELHKLENSFPRKLEGEDYHLYIEQQLTKRLGRLGEKLHTGKSRNDQVATAIRMTLREELLGLSESLTSFCEELLRRAAKHLDTFFVGYTHMQPAQPITFGHYLLSLTDALLRDNKRILEAYHRVNLSPMGSGALAGSSFNLDRRLVANMLGFEGLVENSLDAVGSRDFLLETLGACVLISTDLSRIAEDWIFYGSSDVNIVRLPDEYSSTSSIMPQKKNPDPLEMIRAQSSEIIGNYVSAASILHALPSGYNLDFQQLTPLVWMSIGKIRSCLQVLIGMVKEIRPVTKVSDRYQVQFTVATELANSLARLLDLPFREAHKSVGQAVRLALESHRTLKHLTRQEWSQILDRPIGEGVFTEIDRISDPRFHYRVYRTWGSPNPGDLKRQLKSRNVLLERQSEDHRRLRSNSQV